MTKAFYPKTAVVLVLYDIVTVLSLVYTIIQLKKANVGNRIIKI